MKRATAPSFGVQRTTAALRKHVPSYDTYDTDAADTGDAITRGKNAAAQMTKGMKRRKVQMRMTLPERLGWANYSIMNPQTAFTLANG